MTKSKSNGKCPICGLASSDANLPFCSPRCADVDLHRWLSGVYAVPGKDGEAANDIERNGDAKDDAD